ncbi:hypothetical protein N2152v2_002581 [Parachlorella kessleri]
MTSIAPGNASLAPRASQRPLTARASLPVVAASKKGFGEAGGKGAKQGAKVSKRGKVSSRQDPAQQLKQLQQDEAIYVQSRATSNPSSQHQPQGTSAPAGPAAAGPADDDDDYGDSTTAAMPQQVTDRMLKRILIFSGLPVAGGILLFPFFYFLKDSTTGLSVAVALSSTPNGVTKGVDLPTWVVYIASTLTFGGGLAGITYGILSSSWDPRREGSFLGVTEFQANLPILMERFKRN